MEIRKILDILEAAPPQAGAVGMFGKNPNAPDASTAQPATTGKPVVGTGLVAGSETQGGQVSYGAGASAQRTATPKPAAAAGNAPPAGGTPFTNPVPNAAASPAAAAAQPTPAAAQTKTYGGGYDPNKVQYAYGGKPTPTASSTQSAALDTAKAGAIGGTTKAAPTASATQSAALDTAKTGAIGGTAQSAAPTPVATAPTQTSDQIATAALNAPAQDTSGTSLGRLGAFNTMAEDEELEELAEAFNDMLRLSGLPLNEKAASKQQQKFMGMVHAMQKGEKVKGASKELKAAAKDMSKKDAKDFASTKHKGLPKKVTEGFRVMMDEEGHTLEHIVNRFKHEAKTFLNTGEMSDKLYDALYDYYLDRGEMPYGIAKAREGDPYTWVAARFEADIDGTVDVKMPVGEVAGDDRELTELALLAGLTNEGILDTIQTTIDKATLPKAMHSEYDRLKSQKAEREFQKSGSAYSDDAGTRYDSKGNPSDMVGIKAKDYLDPKSNRDRDLYAMATGSKSAAAADKVDLPSLTRLKEDELNECGDMDMEQPDSFNVSTNMSSDGTKSVNISAQGDRADELLQMLKMAGMRPHDDHDHTHMSKPAVVMISRDDEEMMDETGPAGQPFVPDDGRYIPSDDELPDAEDIFNPLMDEELEEAKKRTTRYVNTPDEEYQTVASITRQGNDLNREKKQFANKARLGDNPMAESTFDADLDAMLESILIREEPIPTTKDPETGRVKATLPPNFFRPNKKRDPASQEIPMEPESPESRVTGPRTMKVPGERTGTENFGKDKEVDEGWEDIKTGVSNFFGDAFGTYDSDVRRSGQMRDLDAMQKKYPPGSPEHQQLQQRIDTHRDRLASGKGEVVDTKGEPIKVLPPDQWKGGK